ncbi:MAG: ABC transporter ATP-binding protein [Alphaproteobacteria bacterium]|nr:ABC transporter ATP-binding protein [Alphaproteobacteria bacterium]
MDVLAVEGLKVDYRTPRGAIHAVDGASFTVGAGQVVGLVGESGCGKTTVARAVTGVYPRNASIVGGKIRFLGQDLLALDAAAYRALRWRGFAFVPQSAMNSLDPVYRVGDQLAEVLTERGGLGAADAARRASELFELVGLSPTRLVDYPHQFSGGMRQRAAIALALALNPKLVIADEPVTALDVIIQRQVLDVIRELQRRLGLSMILVTHDISVVAYVCDRVVVMYAGQVVESGSAAAVLARPFHPYTMGLNNAFPDLQSSAGLLVPIEGAPPDLAAPPGGCRFAPRCPFVQERCRAECPPLVPLAEGQSSACWRATEAETLRAKSRDPKTWLRS